MAKPGSDAARRIVGKGVDLSQARLTDEQAAEAKELMELRSGMRCHGCGRRLTRGYRFTRINPRATTPAGLAVRLSACTRDDCDYAMIVKEDATAMEFVEFAWLDELGVDAPPAKMIVEKNAKAVAAAEVDGGE